jgi:hypothetical protein
MKAKKIIIHAIPHTILHEEGKDREEDKLVTTNTQRKHIHYTIRDAYLKNKQPIITKN